MWYVTCCGKLVGVVVGKAVVGVHLVVCDLLLKADAGILTVEVIAAFSESLIAFSVDAYAKEVVAFIETVLRVEVHLSAESVLLQRFDAQLTVLCEDGYSAGRHCIAWS